MSLSRTNRKALNRRVDKYVKVTVTNAQALTLNASPLTVIAAKTGFTHIPEEMYVTVPAQVTGATIGSATYLLLKYTNGSGATITGNLPVTGLLDGTTAVEGFSSNLTTFVPVASAAVVLYIAGADVTAMTGTFSVRIYFKTLPNQL